MIYIQQFNNIFTTNPKCQVVIGCYCWVKKVILILNSREMICLQHFYNIFTTNPKWQVVTSCYCWDKKVILLLVSNSNQ